MKKLNTLLTMALIAMLSLTFTSCDEDADIAYTLDGTWRGNMYVEYGDYDAVYSVIRFDNNSGLYSGTGYWVDYYDNRYWGGNNYVANHINWTVRNGNIYIDLLEEGNSVVIYDYALTNGRFSGYVETYDGNRAQFNMTKDYSNYNWRDYNYGYYWDYNTVNSTDFKGELTRGSDSEATQNEVPKMIRRFVKK